MAIDCGLAIDSNLMNKKVLITSHPTLGISPLICSVFLPFWSMVQAEKLSPPVTVEDTT